MTKEECYIFMKKIHVNQKVAASNRAGAQNVAGALSMDQARGRLRGNLSQAMANIQPAQQAWASVQLLEYC